MIVGEHRHNSSRRTAPETVMSEIHIPNLSSSEPIDILLLIDTLSDRVAIDM